MVVISSSVYSRLSSFLKKYRLSDAAPKLAGLLTVPALQANSLRLEFVVHLAVANCRGDKKATEIEIGNWLNRQLEATELPHLEDPSEDVFVVNVMTPAGNRRVFGGIWECPDYSLQCVLDILSSEDSPPECHKILRAAEALLMLSDCVADRVGLQRWHVRPSMPQGKVRVTPKLRLDERAKAVSFTDAQLAKLGVHKDLLLPFYFDFKQSAQLASESIGNTTLERNPLLYIDGVTVLVLPTAVSVAIRIFAINELVKTGLYSSFVRRLGAIQAGQVEDGLKRQIGASIESLAPPPVRTAPEDMPGLHSWLFRYDVNKVLHVILLHDKISELARDGLDSALTYSAATQAAFDDLVVETASHFVSSPGIEEGITIFILGGLGRGMNFSAPGQLTRWHMSFIRISDFLLLCDEKNDSLKLYLKFIKQKAWVEEQGLHYVNMGGDINLYSYWRKANYLLVSRDLPVTEGTMVSLASDFVRSYRERARLTVDRHLIAFPDGSLAKVIKHGRSTYFKSMKRRPIYVSVDHLNHRRELAGVIETARCTVWLMIKPVEDHERLASYLYQIWDGFLPLLDRLLACTEERFASLNPAPCSLSLEFGNLNTSSVPRGTIDKGKPASLRCSVDAKARDAVINVPREFLNYFQQVENVGEKLLIGAFAECLISLLLDGVKSPGAVVVEPDELVRAVLPDSGIRIVHGFNARHEIDVMLAELSEDIEFVPTEDFVFGKLRLSDGCLPDPSRFRVRGKAECNAFLHKVVDKVWAEIRSALLGLDRKSLLVRLLNLHEAALADRQHWSRTARALYSLYGSVEDVNKVFSERENERSNVALSARALMEMAICEAPAVGGRQACSWDVDFLLAKVAILMEAAVDSDAVNDDFTIFEIEINKNGEYLVNRDYLSRFVTPFLSAYQQHEFEGAAKNYYKHYESRSDGAVLSAVDFYRADFLSAFHAEYDLSVDELISCFAKLVDWCVESGTVVVESTLGQLKQRLRRDGDLSDATIGAFLKSFSCSYRRRWDRPPMGFSFRDIWPWRFRRRLSVVARPILSFGSNDEDCVVYGAGILQQGIFYVLERSEQGQLPSEFFNSAAMISYIGSANNRLGHEFASEVAQKFSALGWTTRLEVEMTEFGAPAVLGDVDVLAWRSTGEVLCIECKRLQLVRTVAEIAEICNRFRGDAGDLLARHAARVEWLCANKASLVLVTGLKVEQIALDDLLVTSVDVPMMYLQDLPVSSKKIVPIRKVS